MNYKITRISIFLVLSVMFFSSFTAYGDLFIPETPTLLIQNRFTTNAPGATVNLSTNVPGGVFHLVHNGYLDEIITTPSTLLLQVAADRVPPEAAIQTFSTADIFYELSTSDLKLGEYTVFVADQFDFIVLQSELFVVISDGILGSEFKLKSIQVNTLDIEAFDSDQFNYIVPIPESQIPTNSEDLLNLVDGEPMDPEAFTGKFAGEDPNTVLLRPYINFEFSPVPYVVTLVPEETFVEPTPFEEPVHDDSSSDSSSNSSSLTIPERVNNFNSGLNAINTETMTREEIQATELENLQEIKELILLVKDPETAEKVYDLLSETMLIVGRLMPWIDDRNAVVKEIAGITDHSRKLAFLVDNPTANGDLTANYFNGMRQIIVSIEPQEYETKNLKNKVYDLGDQAVSKTGQYQTPQDNIDISNGIGNIEFRSSDITEHIALARGEFNKINGAMRSLLGGNDPRNIKPQLTLDVEKPENVEAIHAEIEKTLLDQATEKGYTELTVNSGEAGIKFANSVLSDSEDTLFIRTAFISNDGITQTYSQRPITGGKIADITMESERESKTKFALPIDLEFDLNQWELDNFTDEALNNLSFFVLNEDNNVWEVVGGNFDPVTQTIKVMRMSLSKYTVMQSQKGFSDLEHAWAKDEINELLGKGIIDDAASFNPNTPITRKDFTVWVSNAYGLSKEDIVIPFEDILENDPHFVEVSTAYSLGIINGKSPTSFDPNGNITREEISTIVSNALTKFDDKSYNPQLVQNLQKYSDFDQVAGWAQNTVSLVDELGIMRGDDVTFRPKDNVTRQEAASIVKRIYN